MELPKGGKEYSVDCYCQAGKTRFYEQIGIEFRHGRLNRLVHKIWFFYFQYAEQSVQRSDMVIAKVINNNVVSSWDADHKEIIVMGRGIGFQKKPGQTVREEDIDKIFRLENRDVRERFKDLLENMPMEYIRLSADIISFAKERLDARLSQSVYLTLTDHLGFAIGRFQEGMAFSNALYREIKRFYPEEFGIGMYALDLIEQRSGIRLPDDEAASIAIHLVDAEFDIKVRDAWSMTTLLQDMVGLLERELQLPKEDSYNRDCLLSNLKFLAHRLLLLPPEERRGDPEFERFIREHCRKEYVCAGMVQDFVGEKYRCRMTEEERINLTLWLKQASDAAEQKGKKGRLTDGLI